MPIVQVQLPDGTSVPVEVPDAGEPTPFQKTKNALVSGGKSVGRGFMSGLASLAEGAAAFNYADRMGRSSVPGNELSAKVREMLPVPADESTFERYSRKGLEGIGGALATPAPGAMLANLFSGGVGGVTGEAGRSFMEKTGPVGEGLGQFGGALLGGGLAAFAAGPKQGVAAADIRRQAAGMTPQQWAETEARNRLLQQSGARTTTAADAFPEGSGVKVLAQEVINSEGGENLAGKIGERYTPGGDMTMLGEKFLDNLAPRVEPATVANRLSDSANDYTGNLSRLATEGVTNALAGKTVKAKDVAEIYKNLMQIADAMRKTQPSLAPVYEEVAQQLLTTEKGKQGFVTDLQGLSFQLKNLKDAPVSPNAGAGRKGADAMWRQAIGEAESQLGTKSPAWKQAMDDYAAFQAGPIAQTKTGAIKKVGDANPNLETPTALSKLNAFTEGYDPATIAGNARLLSNRNMTQGETIDPKEIARALAQQRLRNGDTMNPGKTIRNISGGEKEAELSALLPAGQNRAATFAPLEAADTLQGLKPKGANMRQPEMRAFQALLRPFRTLDMMITARNERGIQQELGRLLGDPANLPKLREIAMFDPTVRRQLTLLSALRPGAFAQSQGAQ